MKQNYQLVMENKIKELVSDNTVPRLLIHSCCAPCSSYVLELLSEYFEITVLYYNPNIYPPEEFEKRSIEQVRFAQNMNFKHPVSVVCTDYDAQSFYSAVKGLEGEREGGARCTECFRLRLEKTAQYAVENGFDMFTTTLTISPLKNSQLLNSLGGEIAQKYGISYFYSDFKKKNGYKRSCELSAQFGLYRQDYCGCVFSKQERENSRISDCPDNE